MSYKVRAVGVLEPGGLEVVRVVERSVREPGPGEVRLRVKAAAVNPTDILLRQRGVAGLPPPWVPGMDAAGLVESVGDGVEHVTVGETVMAAVLARRPEGGAQAELVVVPSASVVGVPEGASVEQAATLPMNGLTAMRGLEMLGLARGATVAVTGGAGLLASYVIAIAKLHGLRVLADSKPEDEALVRSFGADVVSPRGEVFPTAVREVLSEGVDAVFDTALLGRSVFPAIRGGGAIAVVRGWQGDGAERGIVVHQVWVATVLERTDWLRETAPAGDPGYSPPAGGCPLPARTSGRRATEDDRGWPPRPVCHRLLGRSALLLGRLSPGRHQ